MLPATLGSPLVHVAGNISPLVHVLSSPLVHIAGNFAGNNSPLVHFAGNFAGKNSPLVHIAGKNSPLVHVAGKRPSGQRVLYRRAILGAQRSFRIRRTPLG